MMNFNFLNKVVAWAKGNNISNFNEMFNPFKKIDCPFERDNFSFNDVIYINYELR